MAAQAAHTHTAAHALLACPPAPALPHTQNRVGELYSQIRFLRVDPYAFYFCRREGLQNHTQCGTTHDHTQRGGRAYLAAGRAYLAPALCSGTASAPSGGSALPRRKCGCKGLDYPFKSGHRKCDHCE